MKKRGNSEGSIYRRGDGRWAAALTLTGTGRRTFYGKSRQEVARRLAAAIRDRDQGIPVVPEKTAVASYLRTWLEGIESTIRPGTWVRYEEYVRLHINPSLGHHRLSRLAPQHVQELYSTKLAEGLSPTSVRHLHAVLHLALKQALRWGLAGRNATEAVLPPRRNRTNFRALSPEEAGRLIDAARGDRLEALYILAISTGARQGELLALKWREVDLTAGTIQIRATLRQDGTFSEPKTDKARRQISLPGVALEALKAHRVRQLEERLSAGSLWQDHDLVLCNAVGRPLDANNMRRRSFAHVLRRAGLQRMRFHDLRHSTASLLLSQGVHPKVVQELLGHSQIAITMDTYSHLLPTLQKDAMEGLNRLLSVVP